MRDRSIRRISIQALYNTPLVFVKISFSVNYRIAFYDSIIRYRLRLSSSSKVSAKFRSVPYRSLSAQQDLRLSPKCYVST